MAHCDAAFIRLTGCGLWMTSHAPFWVDFDTNCRAPSSLFYHVME